MYHVCFVICPSDLPMGEQEQQRIYSADQHHVTHSSHATKSNKVTCPALSFVNRFVNPSDNSMTIFYFYFFLTILYFFNIILYLNFYFNILWKKLKYIFAFVFELFHSFFIFFIFPKCLRFFLKAILLLINITVKKIIQLNCLDSFFIRQW